MEQDLRDYTTGLERGGVGEFAKKLGITPTYLAQLAARLNDREPSPELCVRIEQCTERRVPRWRLRPGDWHLIWPELIGTEGAPAVAVGEVSHG